MGREVKRVALDFSWPLKKVWTGFLNPHPHATQPCSHCEGTGYSPEAFAVYQKWYGKVPYSPEADGSRPFTPEDAVIRARAVQHVERAPEYYGTGDFAIRMEAQRLSRLFNQRLCHHLNQEDVDALVDDGRLMDLTHTSFEDGRQPKTPAYRPTAREVNDWSVRAPLGHDSINSWIVIQLRCKKAGVSHVCAHCEGEGHIWASPEAKHQFEAWERQEPPAGEGYQIWETVSEGSPCSPVFATPEELAEWMAAQEDPLQASFKSPAGSIEMRRMTPAYEKWLKFIRGPGWAPSAVLVGDGMRDGVEFVTSAMQD